VLVDQAKLAGLVGHALDLPSRPRLDGNGFDRASRSGGCAAAGHTVADMLDAFVR
jgi:hypothetical protein